MVTGDPSVPTFEELSASVTEALAGQRVTVRRARSEQASVRLPRPDGDLLAKVAEHLQAAGFAVTCEGTQRITVQIAPPVRFNHKK